MLFEQKSVVTKVKPLTLICLNVKQKEQHHF